MTFDPTNPGTPSLIQIDSSPEDFGLISCPSVSECIAVSSSTGSELTFDPTAPRAVAAVVIDPAPKTQIDAVSCPSADQCTAVDSSAREITFNPTSPANASTQKLTSRTLRHMRATLACAAETVCVASIYSRQGFPPPETVVFNPRSASRSRHVLNQLAFGGLACPAANRCTGLGNGAETFNPGAAGHPSVTPLSAGGLVIACPSVSQCTTVNDFGQETTFAPNPPRGGCTAPNLRRLTLPEIKLALGRAFCRLGTVSRHRSGSVPRGREISQNPAPHRRTASGVVSVVISRG